MEQHHQRSKEYQICCGPSILVDDRAMYARQKRRQQRDAEKLGVRRAREDLPDHQRSRPDRRQNQRTRSRDVKRRAASA